MTETTRFVSKTTAVIILVIVAAALFMGYRWVQERYALEVQRECLSGLERPDPAFAQYDDRMVAYTNGVRTCLV